MIFSLSLLNEWENKLYQTDQRSAVGQGVSVVLLVAEIGVPRDDHKSFYVPTSGIEPASHLFEAIALTTELAGQPSDCDDHDNDYMMVMLFKIMLRRKI